jgi:hypothetical protein
MKSLRLLTTVIASFALVAGAAFAANAKNEPAKPACEQACSKDAKKCEACPKDAKAKEQCAKDGKACDKCAKDAKK